MRLLVGFVFLLLTVVTIAVAEENEGKIDLNSASVGELTTLPGIGEVKAKAIVEYRVQHNGFKTVEEIMNVKGIGEKTYVKIKDLIYLTPQKKMAVVLRASRCTTWGRLKAAR